jgi:peptidoglycan glycosyltransferase
VNRQLRRVAVVAGLMFLALLINVNYLQVVEANDLATRPGNVRVLYDEYAHQRGPILVDARQVALSRPTDDQLRYQRRYPDGPLYAHATGFYSIVYGASGMERAADPVLSGRDDRLFTRRILDTLTGQEQRGGSVALTIDSRAQRAAAEALGDRRGAVVALDPSTGAVLAMVSSPSYDPNPLASHDPAVVRDAYRRADADPDQPMLNRAIAQRYPPGSTFKLVTAAAALSSGRYTPDTPVPGPAVLDLPLTDADLPNFDRAQCTPGSDTTTLAQALRRSCNTTFGAVGMALGADALAEQAQAFGFGRSLELPLSAAASVFPDNADEPQTAQSAIGQYDVAATPLQMAMVAAGIANRGVVMSPYLVSEVRGPDLSLLSRADPQALSTAVSPQVAATLTSMMVDVVNNGTGTNAAIPGVPVAGKTGTAEHGGPRPHAWFVSFAPAEDPAVAVAVIVEDGGDAPEVSGNEIAAPIARAVMEAVLGR